MFLRSWSWSWHCWSWSRHCRLGLGLGLEVSVLSFQDHSCICQTISWYLVACFCQLGYSSRPNKISNIRCLKKVKKISLPTFQVLFISHVYSIFSCYFYGDCFLVVLVFNWSTVYGLGLEGAGLGLGLGTLVLTRPYIIMVINNENMASADEDVAGELRKFNDFNSARVTFQPFKVIQGHWIWHQSKASMRLPISPYSVIRNLGPILHRFRDIPAFMCSWPHPYSTVILGVFPLYQIAHVGVTVSRNLNIFGCEIIFEVFQHKFQRMMWSRYLNVTDRRTDGRYAIS